MKLAVCLLAAPVAGLVAPAAPARTATVLNAEMSKALPFLTAPKGLKGYIGEEAGFDPVGFAEIMDIKWMREAEIKHGICAELTSSTDLQRDKRRSTSQQGSPKYVRDRRNGHSIYCIAI